MDPTDPEHPLGWAGILREIARGGLAGLIAGVLIGGLGGRVAMSIAAVMNPDMAGVTTEAGAVIGRFTLDGTLLLLFFGGLSAGLPGAVLWVVVRRWLPGDRLRRRLVAMPVAVALGAPLLVESGNFDFRILEPPAVIVALMLGLVALVGLGVAVLDDWLERRLPRGPGTVWRYAVIVLLGLPALLFTVAAYLSPEFSSHPRPFGIGAALFVVGLATAVAWAGRIRKSLTVAPAAISILGRAGLVAAVGLGAWHVARETATILAL